MEEVTARLDVAHLRELAEAVRATPVTWQILEAVLRRHIPSPDLDFIVACSPATILELLRRLEVAEEGGRR